MENKKVKIYVIHGRTSKNSYVCTGWFTKTRGAVEEFIKKYPRFKGEAEIQTQFAEDFGHGVLIASSRWEAIDSFESTKELKQYTGE